MASPDAELLQAEFRPNPAPVTLNFDHPGHLTTEAMGSTRTPSGRSRGGAGEFLRAARRCVRTSRAGPGKSYPELSPNRNRHSKTKMTTDFMLFSSKQAKDGFQEKDSPPMCFKLHTPVLHQVFLLSRRQRPNPSKWNHSGPGSDHTAALQFRNPTVGWSCQMDCLQAGRTFRFGSLRFLKGRPPSSS